MSLSAVGVIVRAGQRFACPLIEGLRPGAQESRKPGHSTVGQRVYDQPMDQPIDWEQLRLSDDHVRWKAELLDRWPNAFHTCPRCGKSIAGDPNPVINFFRRWSWRLAHLLNCR